jgi:CRP-like cAMP-binding protein
MVSVSLLEKIDIFKDLDDNQLEAIRDCCDELEFGRGDKLFTEDDDAVQIWIITEGNVDLRFELPGKPPASKEQTVTSIKSDAGVAKILGWSCFVPPYKMRLSAFCVSRHCKVIRIEKKSLTELFEKDTRMAYLVLKYLIQVVGYRFQQFQDVVATTMGENLMSGW